MSDEKSPEKFSVFLAEPWPRMRVILTGYPEDDDEFDAFIKKLHKMYARADKTGDKVEVIFDVSNVTPVWCMSYVPALVRNLKTMRTQMQRCVKGTIIVTETKFGKQLVNAVLSAFSTGLPRKTQLKSANSRAQEDAWFAAPVTEEDIADSGSEEEKE